MSFLDGLFVDTSTELGVAPGLITLDATIEVGWIYQVGDSEGPCVLSLAPVPIADVVGHRVAVKVVRDGGGVMVIVPEGMTIEGDGGAVSGQVEVPHEAGQYREWICNASGLWLLVAGAAGGGGDTGGGDGEPNPHVWTHADGGLDELDVTGLSGVLADPQPPAPHAATHAAGGSDPITVAAGPPAAHAASHADGGSDEINVTGLAGLLASAQRVEVAKAGAMIGTRKRINLIQGANATIVTTDDPANDAVDVAISAIGLIEAVTLYTWASNAATCNVSTARHFAPTNVPAGNATLTLASGVDGCGGLVFYKQTDAGNATLTFVAAGRTILRDLNVPDSNPLGIINSITLYQYFYATIAGTAYLVINKVYMQ